MTSFTCTNGQPVQISNKQLSALTSFQNAFKKYLSIKDTANLHISKIGPFSAPDMKSASKISLIGLPQNQLAAGHNSDKSGLIALEFEGTDKERVETSEGIGAYLHLFGIFQKGADSQRPFSLISRGYQCVVIDIGGDPARSVADFVEKDEPELTCIPMNPVEAYDDYLDKKNEIDASDGEFRGVPVRAVTSISVLNVISEESERRAHIEECLSILTKKGGYCFFKVWKSENRFGHTINRDIASYRAEIEHACANLEIASNNISNIVDDTIVVRVPSREDRNKDDAPFLVASCNGPLQIEGRTGNVRAEYDPMYGYALS